MRLFIIIVFLLFFLVSCTPQGYVCFEYNKTNTSPQYDAVYKHWDFPDCEDFCREQEKKHGCEYIKWVTLVNKTHQCNCYLEGCFE